MSQTAAKLTVDEFEASQTEPLFSPKEVRRVIVAAHLAGTPAPKLLHDIVMSVVEHRLATGNNADAIRSMSDDWIEQIRLLSASVEAMRKPLDEMVALAQTLAAPVRLSGQSSRLVAETLLAPPEPTAALLALMSDDDSETKT